MQENRKVHNALGVHTGLANTESIVAEGHTFDDLKKSKGHKDLHTLATRRPIETQWEQQISPGVRAPVPIQMAKKGRPGDNDQVMWSSTVQVGNLRTTKEEGQVQNVMIKGLQPSR